MYEVKTQTASSGVSNHHNMHSNIHNNNNHNNKRRSWTGRLRDRFKSRPSLSSSAEPSSVASTVAGSGGSGGGIGGRSPDDEWLLDPWIAKHHPHLHDGHHAHPHPLPAMHGSVFVAANFVYDCRQQYGIDPARLNMDPASSGWHPGSYASTSGTVAHRKSMGAIDEYGTSRINYSPGRPSLFRRDSTNNRTQPEESQFCAEDVNLNLQQLQSMTIPDFYRNPVDVDEPEEFDDEPEELGNEEEEEEEEESHPQTTVAVDRPGLSVSGQRICILTGQDPDPVMRIETQHPERGFISKVILKVNQRLPNGSSGSPAPPPLPATAPPPLPSSSPLLPEFERNCSLRRSLSDRATSPMAHPRHFHDTTKLSHKSRSRGSLHNLFRLTSGIRNSLSQTAFDTPLGATRIGRMMRPKIPPPPPPPSKSVGGQVAPVAPPRRIFRFSRADLDALNTSIGSDPGVATMDHPVAMDLSPGVTSWAGRPLSGQMVSWSAWLGNQKSNIADPLKSNTKADEADAIPVKRRPVSRLWSSFSAVGREKSVNAPVLSQQCDANGDPVVKDCGCHAPDASSNVDADTDAEADDTSPYDHIYEEIIDKPLPGGLTRAGRGSFAGATRQDILRYLEELRKKNPADILVGDRFGVANDDCALLNRSLSPISISAPMTSVTTPNIHLPQLIVGGVGSVAVGVGVGAGGGVGVVGVGGGVGSAGGGDEDEDEDMATMAHLLSAMRHNAPTRNSNRSNASSQSSSQESALSAAIQLPGSHQSFKMGGGEVERNDSGVGSLPSGTARLRRRLRSLHQSHPSHPPSANGDSESLQQHPPVSCWCVDCDQPILPESTNQLSSPQEFENDGGLVCVRCGRRRSERREVLAELLETEVRYARDLRVLHDELYKPLLVAGLVPLRQLDAVFLNVSELSGQSQRFSHRLRDAVELALEQGDDDLLSVDVAKIFLNDKDTEDMMDAFRRYCVRSGEASVLLSSLEKERELLRIFLRASQLENPALRRMDLHAFLMVPVQRITKYPLLLGRLLRATAPQDVETRETLREAQAKVESYLTAINSETKELGSVSRPWGRRGYSVPNLNLSLNLYSTPQQLQRPSSDELMTIRLRKLAVDSLGWSANSSKFLMEGHVKFTQPSDLLLTATRGRASRTLKWQNVWMAVIVLNHQDKPDSDIPELHSSVVNDNTSQPTFGLRSSNIQEAAVIMVKDIKHSRPGPSTYRDPMMLSQCTVTYESEWPNLLEIHQIVTKESYIFQMTDSAQTLLWLHKLRTLSLTLGRWKQRRNALPHVMMIN